MKTFVFDIDNTLCRTEGNDYDNCEPMYDRIQVVNKIYDAGHKIILMTARGMGRSDNNPIIANQLFYTLTQQQLKEWGVKYHQLFLGKPAADHYIDDKGIKDNDFFK